MMFFTKKIILSIDNLIFLLKELQIDKRSQKEKIIQLQIYQKFY